MKKRFLAICLIVGMVIAITVAGGMYARAEIEQGPVPTEPPLEEIAPALNNLSDATPWEVFAQTLFTRKTLHDDEFDMDYYIEMPAFTEAVKALEGKPVTVKGNMITYEETKGNHKEFLVTGTQDAGCGHYHGPASLVVEVHVSEPVPAVKGIVRYTGTLELVPGGPDSNGIFYRLRNAAPAQ